MLINKSAFLLINICADCNSFLVKLAKYFLFFIVLPFLTIVGINFKASIPNNLPVILGILFFNVLNVSLSMSKSGTILLIAFETLSVIPSLSAKTIFFGFLFTFVSVTTSSAACCSTFSVTPSCSIDCTILPNLGSSL